MEGRIVSASGGWATGRRMHAVCFAGSLFHCPQTLWAVRNIVRSLSMLSLFPDVTMTLGLHIYGDSFHYLSWKMFDMANSIFHLFKERTA
ncbi:hypothetical protein SISSUDRAFT_527877 [Sistotremastrum suecicum HHB10207 ss-3]|uniref:Uncharacterized protein n=1 Tax=Sistotremastrum suecicum HHB10207 ss-3 TaxID=1314776 RepID=A0A165XV64_9AGAM|nr:hypothetical protein SISSUDRAFT_527877 [Sistotremastrum suecicum HHB10207 ss-3]